MTTILNMRSLKLNFSIIFILVCLLILPMAVFAASPLALPAYEIVMFDNGEVQMLGFAGGDVQATVGFYGTSSVPSTDTTGTAPWELVPPGATVQPSGLFTEGGEGMPGLHELGDASEATGNPRATLIIIIAFFIALASGLAVYVYTHNARMGMKGSLLLQSLTSLAVMIFFFVGGGGVIPGWVIVPFGLEALFLIVGRNPQHSST